MCARGEMRQILRVVLELILLKEIVEPLIHLLEVPGIAKTNVMQNYLGFR